MSVSTQLRVKTLEQLHNLTVERKCVVSPAFRTQKPRSAAWVLNLPGSKLVHLFQAGLYVYVKKAERRVPDIQRTAS